MDAKRRELLSRIAVALIFVAAIAVRCFLAANEPLHPLANLRIDDTSLMANAVDLLQGNWLGPYDEATLAKNLGYPALLCLPYYTGLSYGTLLGLGLGLSCVVFFFAIKPLVSSMWIRLALSLALLFMPALFTFEMFQRLHRLGVVIPFVIALFASYAALWLRRDRGFVALVPWVACISVCFPALYLIKEDGAWMYPFVGVVSLLLVLCWVIAAIKQRREEGQSVLQSVGKRFGYVALRLVLVGLPFVSLFAVTSFVRNVNYQTYGVNMLCERTDGNYARFYHDLIAIDVGESDEAIWTSNKALERAIEVSPTLASINSELWNQWNRWAEMGHEGDHAQGEMPKDLGTWALRDAYGDAIGFTDAVAANDFWGSAANELEAAFADGRLEQKDGIWVSSGMQPVPLERFPSLMTRDVWRVLRATLSGEHQSVKGPIGNEDSEYVQNAYRMLNVSVNPTLRQLSEFVARVAVKLGKILAIPVSIFLALCFVAVLVRAIVARDKDAWSIVLIVAGYVLSCVVIAVGVWWMCEYSVLEGTHHNLYHYSAAMYPLVYMSGALCLGYIVQIMLDGETVLGRRQKGRSAGGKHMAKEPKKRS